MIQVYLADDLRDELKKRGLPASELLQIALRAGLERQDSLDETSRYLEELLARQVGAIFDNGARGRINECASRIMV